jgi:hypothetical protein
MSTTTRRRRAVAALAITVGLASSATFAHAALQPDGVNLKSQWTNGGEAWLELEDRNVEPEICFVWDNPAPHDGDSITSRVVDRAGTEVVDLGTADQWIDGAGEGCEIPRDDRFRQVFANPGNYVVEVEVVERQGNPATVPVRSQPLQRASG